MPASVSFGFDAKNKRAYRLAKAAAGKLITDITDEALLAIRTLIEKVIRDGVPPLDAARMVLGIIGEPGATTNESVGMEGLNHVQVVSAMNYRKTLIDMGHTLGMVEKLFGKYVKRKLRERATTIARTETMWSLVKGAEAQYSEAVRHGFLPSGGRLRWITTPDERLCDFCRPMHNRTKPIPVGHETTYFVSPQGPIEGPPRHPRCRCTIVFAEEQTPEDAAAGAPPPPKPAPPPPPPEPVPEYVAAGIEHEVLFNPTGWVYGKSDAIEKVGIADEGLKSALKTLTALGVDVSGTKVSYLKASPNAELGAFRGSMGASRAGWSSGRIDIMIGPNLAKDRPWMASAAGAEGVVIHEFGHQQHWKRLVSLHPKASLGALNDLLVHPLTTIEQAIARQVSRYAVTDSAEFVAEVFAGTIRGTDYGDDVFSLYRRLGGPSIPGLLE